MNNALTISVIGASMVFVGLILLWVMMDVLVRLTSREKASVPSAPAESAAAPAPEAGNTLKQQAAAAAVAVALAHASSGRAAVKTQKMDALSPWQSAYRVQQLNQSNALPRRKNH
jgi:sodium pump decarboxylase gamma subunit